MLTYMREMKEGNWARIEMLVEEDVTKKLIIVGGGGLNARTDSEGGWLGEDEEERERKSQDQELNTEQAEMITKRRELV